MCNLSNEKISLFSFSLSQSHCVSLYFSDCTSQLKLSLLCYLLTLELTQKWPKLSVLQLSILLQLTPHGRMAFASFFSFFSLQRVSHTCSAFALNQKLTLEHFLLSSQTSPCFGHFSLNEKTCIEDFWNKLMNEL